MGSLSHCNIFCIFPSKYIILTRHFTTSSTQLSVKNALSKQGKVFNKLLGATSKKKRKFIFDDSPIPSSGNKISFGNHLKNNKENSRRVAVLNSLFMKHISDLLVTGNMGANLLGKGLEISRVSMCPNFNQLNVYWGCFTQKNIEELENILPNIGFTLRHELSQLRVMGVVPRIIFVKDRNFTNGAKVDYLLRIADFGEDHTPPELESDFKAAPDKIQPQNDEPASGETSNPVDDEEAMPPMRQDTFNLDHQLIMNKILKKLQKSRAIHRFEPNLVLQSDGNSAASSDLTEAEVMSKDQRKAALAKFVLNRRILQGKKMQSKLKYELERNYVSQELGDEDDVETFEEEDYINEDNVEDKFRN